MKKPFSEGDLNGFLDRGTEITGELRFQDLMRIDGKFKGKIQSTNMLVVGETGELDAEIEVGTMSISGKVEGTLKALQKIEIHAKGRVYGTLITPKLVIEEGALFQGKCEMETAVEQRPAQSASAPILHMAAAREKRT
ncbi:MAG: polymer-forming cytoskeletal protein [Acidobacteriota bacterium]